MKKTITLFTMLLTITISQLNAQVPNGGFENWSMNQLYEDPIPFESSNFQSYILTQSPNVTKVAGFSGNHAVRMETITSPTDTVEGMILLADLFGLGGGYPYTGKPDSIKGMFKYNIMPGDTGTLAVIFKKQGIFISYNVFGIFGSSSSFTQLSFPLMTPLINPDTVLFLLSCSDLDGGIPGSFLEVDDLILTGTTEQLPNNGFENWAASQYEDPDDWFTANFFSTIFGGPASVTKSTNSASGTYAASMKTVEIGFGVGDSDTMGWMTNGTFGDDGPIGGSAYSTKVHLLSGDYIYTAVGPDTALAMVAFYKWNSSTGQSDSLTGGLIKLPPVASYTRFEIPINFGILPNPDTVLIVFASSNFLDESAHKGVGSTLLLDNLALGFGVGDNQPLSEIFKTVSVYPNPAKDAINIRMNRYAGEEIEIQVFDIIGNRVTYLNEMPLDGVSRLDISQWNAGVYFYKVRVGGQTFSGKFVKE